MDSGDIVSYMYCRGYGALRDPKLRQLGANFAQSITNTLAFVREYVFRKHELRIEEVITLDALRHDIPEMIDTLRIFDNDTPGILFKELLVRVLLYTTDHWRQHFERILEEDFTALRRINECVSYNDNVSLTRDMIVKSMRAQYRFMYFIHGPCRLCNYYLRKVMYVDSTECNSNDRGLIMLAPIEDENDIAYYPLYSKYVSNHYLKIIRSLWDLPMCDVNPENDIVKHIVIMYAYLAYTRVFFTSAYLRKHKDFSRRFLFSLERNYKQAFTLRYFRKLVDRYPQKNQSDVIISHYVKTDHLVKTLLLDPRTSYAKVIRLNARIDNMHSLSERMREFIDEHFEVFPQILYNPMVRLRTWAVVKFEEPKIADPFNFVFNRRKR